MSKYQAHPYFTAPMTNLHPQGGELGIDPGLSADTTMVQAASEKDSHLQAILKRQHLRSLALIIDPINDSQL